MVIKLFLAQSWVQGEVLEISVILGETDKTYCWVSADGSDRVGVENVTESSFLVSGAVILTLLGNSLSCLLLLCHSATKRLTSLPLT